MTEMFIKGEKMQRLVLVVFTLLFAIPALSNAGTVSSRYDVTFGGFVKYDLGWSSQNMPGDPPGAYRSSTSTRAVFGDEYGNTFASGAETRLNFLIKGPDLWGARTSAFIGGDFRGVDTGNSYGGFQIRHAFMTLNWPGGSELMIGQNWQQWGMPYYLAAIGANDFGMYNRGVRQPQVAFRYSFTKEFNAMAGVISATDAYGTTRGYNDDYARSSWPGLMGEVAYWTDRCGRIGSNNLKLALGGYFGKEKVTGPDAADDSNIKDDTIDAWQAAFRYSVPIVPEKQGNKQMGLLLNGNFFIGQDGGGAGGLLSRDLGSGTYTFTPVGGDWWAASPVYFGLFAQASWWLTNDLQINAMYGYLERNFSAGARNGLRNLLNMQQSYAANILWDTNESIRFGLQWMRIFTSYNGVNPGTGTGPGMAGRTGIVDQYRLAAWYFF